MTIADDISDLDLQVAITLCSLTYLDEHDAHPDVQKTTIEQYLAYDDLPMGGKWALVWGPASFELNLWYIAQHLDTGNLALVIRGTVMSSLTAKLGDADVVPVPPLVKNAPPGVTVARGISDSHNRLNVAPDIWTDRTGWQFLDSVFATSPGLTLDVIGHSLGGALAPVVALDAMQRFPKAKVRSFAFAGMSPGNKAFSDWYVSQLKFQTHSRFINPLDIIPKWYGQLGEMRAGFRNNPCPEYVVVGSAVLSGLMDKYDVKYQATPNPYQFNGQLYDVPKWEDQCHGQHEHRYYMLLTGIALDVIQRRFSGETTWSPPTGAA